MQQTTQNVSRSRSLFFLRTQKTQNFSRPRSLFFLRTHNQLFSHLTNSKFRAGLSGVSSDTPSFWKPQFIFQKRDLLQKNWKCACDLGLGGLPTHNQLFSHLTNSKFRAGLSGVSSDTPSFWKPQFIFQKRDLLQKTENLHATLDSQAVKNSKIL